MATSKEYDSSSLKHLTGRDAVRAKPSMYLGSIVNGEGTWTALREVCDNVIDEALNGHCSECEIYVNDDGSFSVNDNGRGIPTDDMTVKDSVSGSAYKIPGLQAVTSLLHAGGKLDTTSPGYKVSRGTHGVGIKASNFLAEYFDVQTTFKGKRYHIGYEYGELTSPMRQVKNPDSVKGTAVTFRPDYKILGKEKMPLNALASWALMASYFTPGLKIIVHVEKSGKYKTNEFYSENGLKDYVDTRLEQLESKPLYTSIPAFEYSSPVFGCGFVYSTYGYSDLKGFTNGLENPQGGEHVNAFFDALNKSLLPYKPTKATFGTAELKEGLIGLINVSMSSPQFASQDKQRLVDARAKELSPLIQVELKKFYKQHPSLPTKIVERAQAIANLKKKFQEDKSLVKELAEKQKTGISIKVVMAPDYKPQERTLYVVEGDSACFVGSTEILTNSGKRTFQDLVGSNATGVLYKDSQFVAGILFEVRETKKVTRTIKVHLETGDIVECTPEHLWLTTTGWVQAQHLTPDHDLVSKQS